MGFGEQCYLRKNTLCLPLLTRRSFAPPVACYEPIVLTSRGFVAWVVGEQLFKEGTLDAVVPTKCGTSLSPAEEDCHTNDSVSRFVPVFEKFMQYLVFLIDSRKVSMLFVRSFTLSCYMYKAGFIPAR